jgi:hypothetical protein
LAVVLIVINDPVSHRLNSLLFDIGAEMTDQEIVLRTFTELQKIAAQYIVEPTHRDVEITT